MSKSRKTKPANAGRREEDLPEGSTKKAFERDEGPAGPPATPLDDRCASGTPAGGTEVGGLAGSNEGDPDLEELHETTSSGGKEIEAEGEGPFSGRSGGAVGGTSAGKRSSGGKKQSRI